MIIDTNKFMRHYSAVFGGGLLAGQRDEIKFLLRKFTSSGAGIRAIAYMLATIKHETADTYRPTEDDGDSEHYKQYVGRLGNQNMEDALRYVGRGYVKITGRDNYRKFGLGNHPDAAMIPEVAFDILYRGMVDGRFTGIRLADCCDNFTVARRAVGGGDEAALIAEYADKFLNILEKAIAS